MIVPGPLREISQVVQLSSGFSFTRNSSRAPCALVSFSRARMPRSACTHDVTCELYCTYLEPVKYIRMTVFNINSQAQKCSDKYEVASCYKVKKKLLR